MNTIYRLLFIAPLMVGCASMTGTNNQPVSINTTLNNQPITEATCELKNSKGVWHTTTPGSVTINKAYGDLTINCVKDHHKGTKVFESEGGAGVWGNALLGGPIGWAIDAGNGSGFSYPQSMTVPLDHTSETKKTSE